MVPRKTVVEFHQCKFYVGHGSHSYEFQSKYLDCSYTIMKVRVYDDYT